MILDTSAVIAILRDEPEADDFRALVEASRMVAMSAGNVLELAMVIGRSDPGLVELFIEELGVTVLPVDTEHLRWARHGYVFYGRGSGSSARLNYGGCLAYGAARATGQGLLYIGEDFVHTDVRSAWG
ncbi:MAG: type II toxin-antitoxin system VapC family toxin [Propionicimonas sp.]|nr:type II toxin-antitoxin system VapC family toxin [Propionicimonas sp.]MEA5116264.1 type II toxin-antitoxin system VapC family toxin [Propionicimonas sp.]